MAAARAYAHWSRVRGAVLQLTIDLVAIVAIVAGGLARWYVQHRVHLRRQRAAGPAPAGT